MFKGDDRTSVDASNAELDSGGVSSSYNLSCWLCRQPLEPDECVRFRGEPVHEECL